MRRVALIYRWLPQYREGFYNLLRQKLASRGIEFKLIYGEPGLMYKSKGDLIDLPWGVKIKQRVWSLRDREIIWQPALQHLQGVDLIIVEHAGQLLLNYLLLARQALGGTPIAFWGHGKCFQQDAVIPLNETFKRVMARRAHWWFAYNDLSSRIVEATGFPRIRITDVQNAIDTNSLRQAKRELGPDDLQKLRNELGIDSDHVAIYIGGMYRGKRLQYLLDACDLIRDRIPDFHVILLGAGPDAHVVVERAQLRPWIHYVGPRFNEQKVPFAALARCLLMPGAVGLSILDAFALETPIITTTHPSHGPEVDYLVDGVNGLLVKDAESIEAYANAVISVMTDDALHKRLVDGCKAAAGAYTIEEMASRFAEGVVRALEAPRRRILK